MKRIVFMICLLGGWMTCCFAQGIVFCELTLEAACRQADSEGKYVRGLLYFLVRSLSADGDKGVCEAGGRHLFQRKIRLCEV